MPKYIYEYKNWPNFEWDSEELLPKLAYVRNLQGRLLGEMEQLGFEWKEEAALQNLAIDIVKNSEIEGEVLDLAQVRSSIARRLGLEVAGLVPSNRYVDDVVEMTLDATRNYKQLLTADRLFGWHAALFPTGRSSLYKITVGDWRKDDAGPMQVVSGGFGRERVHFQAPSSDQVAQEMTIFLNWFNQEQALDNILKAAIAHLWFITIHPFDDGNGRITRALTDLQLARSDESPQRFYSMSAQIRKQRKSYYEILERTQKGDLEVTAWLLWFLDCLEKAILETQNLLSSILTKAKFWQKHQHVILNERQKKMLNKLLDNFEGKLTTSKWAKMTKSSSDTALRDIQDLVVKGILRKGESGGRSTSYELVI